MEKRKNFLIGLLSGVCLTLMLCIIMGFNKINPENMTVPLDKEGNLVVRLSDEDLKKISSNLVDDNYIITRLLYCLDGSTISNGKFTTYCDR